jgi:hypothetical protein
MCEVALNLGDQRSMTNNVGEATPHSKMEFNVLRYKKFFPLKHVPNLGGFGFEVVVFLF